MKTTDRPKAGHLYYTFDGAKNIVPFNQGSAKQDGSKDTLPIEVVNDDRVWVTNVGLLPISRKVEDVFELESQAHFYKNKLAQIQK